MMIYVLLALFALGCYFWFRAFWLSRDPYRDRYAAAMYFFYGLPVWALFVLLGSAKLIHYIFFEQ